MGERWFRTLDYDDDGKITVEDLEEGLKILFEGEDAQKAELLFEFLDFNAKGYVTKEDVLSVFVNAKKECSVCGKELFPHLANSVEDAFSERCDLDFEDLLKSIRDNSLLLSYILKALIIGIPASIRTFYSSPLLCCDKPQSDPSTLRPLKLDGRKYYAEIVNDVLCFYNSVMKYKLNAAVLLKDVYIEVIDAVSFTLGNHQLAYSLSTDTPAEREKWLRIISEKVKVSSFGQAYERLALVGRGACGQVYQALHKPTRTITAVKVVKKATLDRTAEVALRREINILRCTFHPSIIELLDVFETKEEVQIVTEFAGSGSLFEWLEARSFRISEADARLITSDIASGLAYLHSRGIVHRDIKLENILLDGDQSGVRAKIIDFGLSCFVGPNEHVREPVGTLKYAAPEVVSRLKYREKADSWGLGVVLYVLLHRAMPFGGKSDEEIALSILKRKLHFAGAVWEAVSREAVAVVAELLNRNPRSRLSAKDVLESQWLRSANKSCD